MVRTVREAWSGEGWIFMPGVDILGPKRFWTVVMLGWVFCFIQFCFKQICLFICIDVLLVSMYAHHRYSWYLWHVHHMYSWYLRRSRNSVGSPGTGEQTVVCCPAATGRPSRSPAEQPVLLTVEPPLQPQHCGFYPSLTIIWTHGHFSHRDWEYLLCITKMGSVFGDVFACHPWGSGVSIY